MEASENTELDMVVTENTEASSATEETFSVVMTSPSYDDSLLRQQLGFIHATLQEGQQAVMNANFFSAFAVCGCLVAITIFRGFHR